MEKKTNFQKVSDFNGLIGNMWGVANIDQIDKQFNLIMSEMIELQDAIEKLKQASARMALASNEEELAEAIKDRDEAVRDIRDGICDVLVTDYGLAHRMGIDADADMAKVCDSNDSKFYKGTESEAAEVCKALANDLGINVEARQRLDLGQLGGEGDYHYVWAFVSADDSDPERPRGKLLKAPGYRPPAFD